MTSTVERRLAELERLVAEAERGSADAYVDPFELSDQECVELYRRLNKPRSRDWGPPAKRTPAEKEELLRQWRELTCRQ